MSDAVLTHADRRTIAQLGQPRSVDHLTHELRIDPHARTREADKVFAHLEADKVFAHLEDLAARGLVVNLGSHLRPADAVKKLPKEVFPFHDESAQIWEKRIAAPHHQWRLDGDLWILSNAGADALKQPAPDEPDPMTVSQVQALIDEHWSRTVQFVGDSKEVHDSLAKVYLADEFTSWAIAVADDCEKRWGKRPILPIAGGAGWTDVYENQLLDAENQKTALGVVVDPWYMALVILALTDTDTGTTAGDGTHVPTYTGYARKSVAGTDMAAAASGSAANTSAIIFAGCTAGSSTIVGAGNCSAATVGTLRKYGTTASTAVSTTQTPPQFAVSAYVTTAD